MSVKLDNRWIVVSNNDPSYLALTMNLEFIESGTRRVFKKKSGKTTYRDIEYKNEERLFKLWKNNDLLINRGLFDILNANGYFSKSSISYNESISEFYNFPQLNILGLSDSILDGISLRTEQLVTLRKMLYIKRGIVQLPTGTGKTEIMCAFIKLFYMAYEKYPTTLIIENNINLVNATYKRMHKYGIPCNIYSDTRRIDKNSINVCHPSSVCNDLDKNSKLLDNVVVLLCDECHHIGSDQNRKVVENCSNVNYCIGLSASAITQDHIYGKRVTDFSIAELKIMSLLGNLMINMVSGDLIEQNKLATPVLLRFYNDASEEEIDKINTGNWHAVQKIRLQSIKRNEVIVRCSEFFTSYNRKVLILVNTIEWSHKLLMLFDEFGMSNQVRASYGGGKFEKFDEEYKEFVSADEDVLDKFNNGTYKILIGTSHIYEGTDISNLDVIILAYGGRKDRLQIQGTGRALRITKTGKYAYIVDFNDVGDRMLSRQSNERFERYQTEMKIPESRIFNDITIGDLSDIFKRLEGIN